MVSFNKSLSDLVLSLVFTFGKSLSKLFISSFIKGMFTFILVVIKVSISFINS